VADALTGVVVCDTSVLAAMVFFDRSRAQAQALTRGHRLLAPRLLRYELAQVAMRRSSRAPVESAAGILQAFAAALRLPIRLIEPEWVQVVELAGAHGLSAYDASYLQIALALGVPLATLDSRLGKVAEELGIRALPGAAA
jgi:predicted nucleic acid-binding protein